jgi:hypothetical protein
LISVFSDIAGIGERLFSAIRGHGQAAERARFEHGKQQFLMQWVTDARTRGANARRPIPGAIQFRYCESLTGDGFVDREILTGYYILKGLGDETDYN